MRRKLVIYLAMALGIMMGYLPLSSWLLRPKTVDAQCVRYFLVSDVSNPACGAGNTKISQVTCNPGTGAYSVGARVVALCIGP